MNLRAFLADLRRRRVFRVAGAYLVAAFVVVQVADVVVEPLGLPSWVMTLVVVLTGLGLPLALALAWAFDVTPKGIRRADDAPDQDADLSRPDASGRESPEPHGSPSLRWPRGAVAWAAALVVAGVVAVLVAGWPGLPSPDEVVLDHGLVAVLPARVAGADASVGYLREGVVDLVGAKLGVDTGLRSVDSRTLLHVWREMGGGEDLLPEAAVALARGLGAGRLLWPEAAGPPNRLTLSATLLSVEDGRELGREQVVGPVDSLDALLDELVVRVLAVDAGEERHRVPSLSRSLPALEAYLRGRVHYRAGRHDEAVRAYHEAIEIDSTFALAALAFRETVYWTLVLREYAPRAERLAWRYRDRLSPRDRQYLEALMPPGSPDGEGTYAEWVAQADRALRMSPDRPELWNWYADVLIHYGVPAGEVDALGRARRAMQRAVELDPGYAGPTEHLADLAAAAGDSAGLRRIARTYLDGLPLEDHDGEVAVEIRWLLHMALGDPPPSSLDSLGLRADDRPILISAYYKALLAGLDPRFIRNVLARYYAGPGADELTFRSLRPALALLEGRPEAARAVIHALTERGHDPLPTWIRLLTDRLHVGDRDGARGAVREIEAELAGSKLDGGTHLWAECVIGQWQALGGDTAAAPATAARVVALADSVPVGRRGTGAACAATIEAAHAAVTGDPQAATKLARAESIVGPAPLGSVNSGPSLNLVLARLHEASGDREAALRALRRADIPYNIPQVLQVKLREEGRLSTLLGDRDAAIAAYRRYLALRPEPEPAERGPDQEVRRALEQLMEEAAG